jgi:predicted Fe-Mo cluster-binding NifX family protein
MLAQAGVDRLVTAHCGPKAFRVLAEAGIKVFLSDAATVAEALEAYMSGKLVASEAADVAGHWA